MRSELYPSVDNLIRESGGVTGEAKPFAEHVDHIMARIIEDERPSQSTLDDWKNDALRVKAFFVNVPACDIELEHVNAYINKYHASASANVQNRKVSFLKKLFSYAVDESLMQDNPAIRKKCVGLMRRKDGACHSSIL